MENNSSPERRSKVVRFGQNYRLDALIVLERDEKIHFSLENDPKRGPLDDFFPFSGWIQGKQIFKKLK